MHRTKRAVVAALAVLCGCLFLGQDAEAQSSPAKQAKLPQSLRVSQVRVQGELTERDVRRAAEKRLKVLEKCFPRSKSGVQPFETYGLKLFVGAKGRVVASTLERPRVVDDKLRSCLQSRAMDIRFAAKKKHSTVNLDLLRGNQLMNILGAIGPNVPLNSVLGNSGLSANPPSGGGTIGLGNLTPIGRGAGKATGFGFQPNTAKIRVTPGRTQVSGSLDDNTVRRILRRHLNSIRYCYEQEVAGGFKGTGRVTPSFVIEPTGRVKTVRIKSTTLGNSKVASCITGVIKQMRFPQPPSGGVVRVTHPYIFSLNP